MAELAAAQAHDDYVEELKSVQEAREVKKKRYMPKAYGFSKELVKRGLADIQGEDGRPTGHDDSDGDSVQNEEDILEGWEVAEILDDKYEGGVLKFKIRWKVGGKPT